MERVFADQSQLFNFVLVEKKKEKRTFDKLLNSKCYLTVHQISCTPPRGKYPWVWNLQELPQNMKRISTFFFPMHFNLFSKIMAVLYIRGIMNQWILSIHYAAKREKKKYQKAIEFLIWSRREKWTFSSIHKSSCEFSSFFLRFSFHLFLDKINRLTYSPKCSSFINLCATFSILSGFFPSRSIVDRYYHINNSLAARFKAWLNNHVLYSVYHSFSIYFSILGRSRFDKRFDFAILTHDWGKKKKKTTKACKRVAFNGTISMRHKCSCVPHLGKSIDEQCAHITWCEWVPNTKREINDRNEMASIPRLKDL